jgi:hypothetical protein
MRKLGLKDQNKNTKVYISGKITGLVNYKYYFKEAELYLRSLGYRKIVNPVKVSESLAKKLKVNLQDIEYTTFMNVDIKLLCDCDIVYLLKNWEDSDGAKLEKLIAEKLNIRIIKGK